MYVRWLETVFAISPRLKVVLSASHGGKAGFLLHSATVKLPHTITVVDIIHLPLLLSLHNRVVYYAQADDVEYYDNIVLRKLMDVLYRNYFARNDPAISMSRHLSDIFRERYGSQIPYTIETGIDHSKFYPEIDEELAAQKEGRKAIILMARGDRYRKGFDVALDTLRHLSGAAQQNCELWVCGERLEETALPVRIRNFGTLSDARLRQVLSSADIFLYPSRHEGFGLFPLEAMACGIVAVTTEAIPYARQTSSMLTSPVGDVRSLADALTVLTTDEHSLKNLKNQAIMDARGYDLEKSKRAFEAALQNIVARK
jgi:glycosyltransferase involved in cell wall biosynthesis